MITVSFGNFTKKKNSTAKPPAGFGAAFAVSLKEDCSIDAPVFLLTAPTFDANYCVWGDHYYYVTDVVSERNNGWRVTCALDFLATYATEIKDTSAFIEYATDGNTQVIDQRLGVEYGVAGVNTNIVGGAIPYMDVDINDSGFFISVIGQNSTDTYFIGATALEYLFSTTRTWVDTLLDQASIDTSSVEKAIGTTMYLLVEGFKQLIASGNAADCVRDAYCLPIVAPMDVLSGASSLWLGTFNTGIQANKILGAGNVERTVTVAIPHQYADWRKQSPYEVCQLFLPLYGTINIPTDIAADSDSLSIRAILNVRSGDYTYYISGNGRGGHEIVVGGNCAAPIAVGASNINMMQAVSAGLGVGVNAMYGNMVGAAASLMSIAPAPHSVGQTGGISNRSPRIVCYVYYRNTTDTPTGGASVQGIPLQATRRIGDLTGYVQTRGASVSGIMHGDIYDAINAALDAGVFVE